MPETLPPEVITRILNSLTDRQTLCNCALACRQWLLTSRSNLFYRVAISHRHNFDTLVRVKDAPHIAPALKCTQSLQLRDDKERPWIHLFPLLFSGRLPSMHFFDLHEFIWDTFPLHRSFYAVGTHFPSVTTLKFADGKFYNFSEFRRVVCSFRQLVHLFVDNVEWRIPPSKSACGGTSAYPRLQMLWFNSKCAGAIPALVEWLLRTPSSVTLSDIQIWEQYSGELSDLQRLTRTLGLRLEYFQVSLKFWTRDKHLDLSTNASLRTLHVRDITTCSCQYLRPLLERLSPANLTALSLYLHIPTLEDLDVLRAIWAEATDPLTRDAFAALGTVTIWLFEVPPAAAMPIAELTREVQTWMPHLEPRMFLRVLPWLYLDG